MTLAAPPRPRVCAVYLLTNIVTGQHYVGVTKNLGRRWSDHVRGICRGGHTSKRIRRAMETSQPTDWQFKVLALCEPDTMLACETDWIRKLKPELNEQMHTPKPKQTKEPKDIRSMTIPLTVKLNKAMWMGLERINPDARIALRLIAVQRLLDLKLLKIGDVPPSVQDDLE